MDWGEAPDTTLCFSFPPFFILGFALRVGRPLDLSLFPSPGALVTVQSE